VEDKEHRDEICIAYVVLMIYLVRSQSEVGILLYIRTSDVLDEKIDSGKPVAPRSTYTQKRGYGNRKKKKI